MCVGISAKVVNVDEDTAIVDVSGAKRKVSADLIEDLEPGDYVMVHAGIAIAKITDSDTNEMNKIMETL
jgi:hydrogenase expression/formation protein HypC